MHRKNSKTEQIKIRVTPEIKQALKDSAALHGKPLGTHMVESTLSSNPDLNIYQKMVFNIIYNHLSILPDLPKAYKDIVIKEMNNIYEKYNH